MELASALASGGKGDGVTKTVNNTVSRIFVLDNPPAACSAAVLTCLLTARHIADKSWGQVLRRKQVLRRRIMYGHRPGALQCASSPSDNLNAKLAREPKCWIFWLLQVRWLLQILPTRVQLRRHLWQWTGATTAQGGGSAGRQQAQWSSGRVPRGMDAPGSSAVSRRYALSAPGAAPSGSACCPVVMREPAFQDSAVPLVLGALR